MSTQEPSAGMVRLPPREFQAEGYPWAHTVTVALPPSYHAEPTRTYPVLWVTDPAITFDLTVATVTMLSFVREIPEMIVVGIGSPAHTPQPEFTKRRLVDFGPREDWAFEGMVESPTSPFRAGPGGRADEFLALMVDTIRPDLAGELRMDLGTNVLVGQSGGGVFAAYTLLTRPEAFTHYLCGSPPANAFDFLLFDLEEQFAVSHDDLAAKVHVYIGESENLEHGVVELDLFGSAARLARALHLRQYPSLDLSFEIVPGEGHITVLSAGWLHGLRTLFQNKSSV